ncbi:MAG: hypothetical protein ABGX16_05040 [Pirellulales bacterium]
MFPITQPEAVQSDVPTLFNTTPYALLPRTPNLGIAVRGPHE